MRPSLSVTVSLTLVGLLVTLPRSEGARQDASAELKAVDALTALGGRVELKNRPGEGCCFTIWLCG